MRKEKKDLIGRLSNKLKQEGYVIPSISAINPEMRTGNWCASAAFEFMLPEKIKAPSYVWVTQTVVNSNDQKEYLSNWQKTIYPQLTSLVKKGLLKDVKIYQQIIGGDYTNTFMFFFDSMAKIEEFLKGFRIGPEKGKDVVKRINTLVQKRTESLLVEIM